MGCWKNTEFRVLTCKFVFCLCFDCETEPIVVLRTTDAAMEVDDFDAPIIR